MYATQAAVVTVKPAGTGIPIAVISARPIPLPPSSSRPSSVSFREVEHVAVVHPGQDYRGSFRRLDGPKADSDTDAMRRTSLMLALLALLVVLSMAGGGFFDGHL